MNAPNMKDEIGTQHIPIVPPPIRYDGKRRIHEHHLEQEHDHRADVVGPGLREEYSVLAEKSEALPNKVIENSVFNGAARRGSLPRRLRPSV